MPKIALIQQRNTGECEADRQRGLLAVEEAAAAGSQIIAFAELAFNPFFPQEKQGKQEKGNASATRFAETIPGPTTDLFAAKAADLGVVIILNLYERDGSATFDSSPVLDADGSLLGVTRMIHITDFAWFHERDYYTPGDRGAPVYDTAHGRIGVAICYDRHFPEYMRALALAGAEVVIIPQAGAEGEWPDGLYEAELRVAAFQNGYFTALCNRVGAEPKVTFAGESFICGPDGTVIARAGSGTEEILYADLDLGDIPNSPARQLFLPDRRPELYGEWLTT